MQSITLIHGDGNQDARLMFVGERPGKDENKAHRVFVGKSGVELDRYLWNSCHIRRSDVFCTNIVRDYKEGDPDPEDWEIKRDEYWLMQELDTVMPEFIVPLGRFSTRWFLGDDVDMEWANGQCFVGHSTVPLQFIVPIYHPAAGMHNTELQARVWDGFQGLAEAIAGDPRWACEDGISVPNYGLAETPEGYSVLADKIAVDTEGSKARPWCLTWSTVHGQAGCVRPGKADIEINGRVIMHNALHDLAVLRAMGIELEDGTYDDTMVKAYELCLEPQGLKALARRHCGMKMREYDDLVGPISAELAETWLSKLYGKEWGAYTATGRRAKGRTSGSAGKKSGKTSRKKRRR